jgi:hypothetical protein
MLDRTKLAADILVDMHHEAEKTSGLKIGAPTKCFLCRASYLYDGWNGDNSGRFCSACCRDAYDHLGLRYSPPEVRYNLGVQQRMTPLSGGFRIACRSCGCEFNSKGLGYCSDECRSIGEARKEAKAAGHEPHKRRQCEASGCGRPIPRYTPAGKATAAKVRWCCPAHRKLVLAMENA